MVLFVVFRPTWDFFSHLKTSPLSVTCKGWKFWTILGTHGLWAVRVLKRTIPIVTRVNPLEWSSPRTRDTRTYCRAFGSGVVITCFNNLDLCRTRIESWYPACEERSTTETPPRSYVWIFIIAIQRLQKSPLYSLPCQDNKFLRPILLSIILFCSYACNCPNPLYWFYFLLK